MGVVRDSLAAFRWLQRSPVYRFYIKPEIHLRPKTHTSDYPSPQVQEERNHIFATVMHTSQACTRVHIDSKICDRSDADFIRIRISYRVFNIDVEIYILTVN